MSTELEERFQELAKTYSVQGCLLLTSEGAVIKTNLVRFYRQISVFGRLENCSCEIRIQCFDW